MTTIEDIRFPTPDEIEGFWAFDKMHAPRPLHPLSQDLVMATISRSGSPSAQAEYDCPIVASSQAINHYFYMAFHPHPDPAEVDDRMSRYLGMVDKTVPLVGKRWANDWLPMIRTRNEAERDVDYSRDDRRPAVRQVSRHDEVDGGDVVHPRPHQLRPHLGRRALRLLRRGHAAGRSRPSRTRCCRGTTPAPSTPPTACGTSAGSPRTARRSAGSSTRTTRETSQPGLEQTEEGRDYLAKVDAYLYDFGWRTDAVYDLADVPWREDPQIPLGNIARYIPMDDSRRSDDPVQPGGQPGVRS